jgi:hypothetical protein
MKGRILFFIRIIKIGFDRTSMRKKNELKKMFMTTIKKLIYAVIDFLIQSI